MVSIQGHHYVTTEGVLSICSKHYLLVPTGLERQEIHDGHTTSPWYFMIHLASRKGHVLCRARLAFVALAVAAFPLTQRRRK
jgi:hypothetical protein